MSAKLRNIPKQIAAVIARLPYLFTYFQVLFIFFFLMTVSKFLFLSFHKSLASEISYASIGYSLLYGLKYDLSAAAICASISILLIFMFHRYLRINDKLAVYGSLSLTVFIALGILVSDSIYFIEAQRHLGYEVVNFITDPVSLTNFIFSRYWFLILVYTITFFSILVYSFYRLKPGVAKTRDNTRNPDNSENTGKKRRRLRTVLFPEFQLLLIAIISAVVIRGGVQAFPLEPIHVNYLGNSSKASIALNGLYNAIYYSVKPHAQNYMKKPDSFDSEELKNILTQMYSGSIFSLKKPAGDSNLNKYNVVIIYLESWDAYHMKSYGNNHDVTPNFDRLRKESLTTNYMFSGGTRTSEGLFASLCSYPNPLGQAIVKTTLEQHKYYCLPEILAGYGYHNYFFQGTSENLARTGDFVRKLGFHESYGEEHIKNPKYSKNWFGVHDPDLYDFVMTKVSEMREPFLIGINTGTTHDSKLPDGVGPRFTNEKENVMNFADEAIVGFLNKFKKNRGLFKRTIFVMLADHTSHATISNFKRYSIPFLIYGPGLIKPEKINIVAAQRDMAPTILDILSLPTPDSFAGKSILPAGNTYHFADYYHNGMLGWIEGDVLVEISLFSAEKPLCYNYANDLNMEKPVLCPADVDQKIKRAKYFTYDTQNLLFSGKTINFKKELLHEKK